MKNRVLVIGDTHVPFEHKDYLDFCIRIHKHFKCNKVVHIGDLVDNHAISYHEHDPNGLSPIDEYKKALGILKSEWYKAFPRVLLCRGNHDRLVDRKGKTAGLHENCLKPFREMWELPRGWVDDWSFNIDGVLCEHGLGTSGKTPHLLSATNNRVNTVIGHNHSVLGVEYTASEKDCIFGMSVGCGLDRKSYAMAYGKDCKRKPILGCGVILDSGKNPLPIKMDM